MLPSVQAKTREQATYEVLRQAIVAGRWAPGTSLVGSRLADEIGVSRITIANALKRLAGEGFVETTPHKGAVVARLDPAVVREIYLMRAALEALAASEAATRMDHSDLERLHARNAAIAAADASGADMREVRQLDREFHEELRSLSGMPTLARTLLNLADQCEGYRARLLDTTSLVRPSEQRHARLLDALACHDGELAGAAMQAHISEGLDVLLQVIGAQQAEGTRSS
ncbi:MAG TPA: GntR family transcriptional regulator [Thermomicrobiales bacterium]|nr:GntR family transcriptional regulator [Thermomicrobiales bacterium]